MTGIIKKIFLSGLAALALIVAPVFVSSASASEDVQVIHVSGTFQTQQPIPSPLCAGFEDCVVDDLTGTFNGGTNRLITEGFVENDQRIVYHDSNLINTNGYGTFTGNEYGTIDKATEVFDSVSVSTSTDGCGSKLVIYNHGTIDLDSPNLEDAGNYVGVLYKKTC